MDKTININLGGSLFQIDEDAFGMLREYLQAINNRLRNARGGPETIEDIELRIAEIFQSQKGRAGVVTKENVEAMIAIIGKPEEFDQIDDEAKPAAPAAPVKKLYRNPGDSIIGGVCGGLGAYLNADPVLFRVLFILFTLFFGTGAIVYIVLWIALPAAKSTGPKSEFHRKGGGHDKESRQGTGNYSFSSPSYADSYRQTSGTGSAINEIFRAIVRGFYLIMRIALIIIGIVLVLSGFILIVSFVMIFIFKYPGIISTNEFNINLEYFPDFLNYVVNPSVVPWITGLMLAVLILPMLAIIYWGVRMIFWFRARDGKLNLIFLVLWVMSVTALVLILFREGISFAETARSASSKIITHSPGILYVKSGKRLSDLNSDKEFTLDKNGYSVFINEGDNQLYIRPLLKVKRSEDDLTNVSITRRSWGRNEIDAFRKAEGLMYNYSSAADTLFLDEYFALPSGRKWSADMIRIDLSVPAGTTLKFDRLSLALVRPPVSRSGMEEFERNETGKEWSSFIFTGEGLKHTDKSQNR
jgi:phage shock protein PspC (stress-responsive transcriptional regulator)